MPHSNQNDIRKLLAYVQESVDNEEDFHFLRFEHLQRLNIVSLELELAKVKVDVFNQQVESKDELAELRTKLHHYAIAVRDYQYLQDKKRLSKDEARNRKFRLQKHFYQASSLIDPWQSHYSFFQDAQHHYSTTVDPLRGFLMSYLPSRLTFSRHERQTRTKEYEEGLPPREVSAFVDRLSRLVIAISGGIFLVVPMIVMTLQPSETKSLVTVTVGVLIFAIILAFGIQVSNVETLVSTATYAAVLVVFVGTSSGGSGTGSN